MLNGAFIQLLYRDLSLFRREYVRAIINSMLWLCCMVAVSNYILPAMGMASTFGRFILVGGIATISIFRCFHCIPIILRDMEGEGTISYYLTLPMKQYQVFVWYAMSFAIKTATISLSVLFLSKLFMWQILDLANFEVLSYLVIFIVMHIFVGFLAILIASYLPDMTYFENAWARVFFPSWFLGCNQFSWITLKGQLPILAYLDLLNPMTYLLEGFRAAVLGQAGYLNIWLCCGMLLLFAALFAWMAIHKLMRRLDCV